MGTFVAVNGDRASTLPTVLDRQVIAVDFDDFYRAEYAPMVRLARALLDTSESAEEIAQDAFARVFERWDRLDSPGGYLRTAVVNGARSELRKREVRRRVGLGHPRPVAAERDYLLDALDSLPPKRKTALVLRFYAGLSEREIAETMGVRPGTVKSMVSRGLAQLREVIEQ
ncbi:MAG: SigE family RNA polymerase sigma factor [Acidimicrobiia bacterium]|nr:SigE family RNA polymerase sigma factor [Acidimicrobiia bacterium]